MMDIKVGVEVKTLHLMHSRAVTGEIYFEDDGFYFPELHWNDFIIEILNWWIKVTKKITTSNIGASDEFLFKDGPFLVRACKLDQDIMRMDFIKRQLSGEIIMDCTDCKISRFSHSLLVAAKKVLEEINERKWEANELDNLRNALRGMTEE